MKIRILPKTSSPATSFTVGPVRVAIQSRPLRVLDFDIENRPLSYIGSDFTTAEITAIAWSWVGSGTYTCLLLGEADLATMLTEFTHAFDYADIVTGHFIRGHDLPMINGALMEQQLPVLSDKMVQDTKVDLVTRKGISASQENLAAMFGLASPKVHMNQAQWREANRLTKEGLNATRERVIGDVKQHIEFRAFLHKQGYLGPPAIWKSAGAQVENYTP